jgi:hypothetical protein
MRISLISAWQYEESEIRHLLTDDTTKGIPVPENHISTPRIRYHWNQLRDSWFWEDAASSTEEILWERVALLTDMWKWYGEICSSAGREMVKYWHEGMKMKDENSYPQRWLYTWTPKEVAEEVEMRNEDDDLRAIDLETEFMVQALFDPSGKCRSRGLCEAIVVLF